MTTTDPLRQPEVVPLIVTASPVALRYVRSMLDDGADRLITTEPNPDYTAAARVALSLVRQIDQVLRRRNMEVQ